MYIDLINNLTAEDRRALALRGVPSTRVSEWKTGLRLPTRPQAIALAEVKGVDALQLETELVLIETEKEAEKKPEMAELLTTVRQNYKRLLT